MTNNAAEQGIISILWWRVFRKLKVSGNTSNGSFDSIFKEESHDRKITHECPLTVYTHSCVSNYYRCKYERTELIYSPVEIFW